jgi:hypothetical protein
MSAERIASIAVAVPGIEADYLDLAELDRVDDSRKLIEWFAERKKIPVNIDARDPAASLVNDLRRSGIKVNVTTERDMGRACGGLYDAVIEGRIWHCGQEVIEANLEAVGKRLIGKSGLWEYFSTETDHTPLRAITLAHYGLSFKKKRTGAGRSSSGRTAVSV